LSAAERAAWLDRVAEEDDAWEWEEWPEPEELTADELAELAELREAAEAMRGLPGGQYVRPVRRGPGQPGSARPAPGESCSQAAAFGAGMALDVMPGCPELAWLADAAAGDDDRYAGASDDELAGVIAAWDRLEAHMAARKLAAAAEFLRRRPEPGSPVEGPAAMPAVWEEFAADQLRLILAVHRGHGCARSAGKHDQPGRAHGHDPPGFALTAAGGPGPPGGYGTWPRPGTRPAPGRAAGGPPRPVTSSTTCRTRRAAGPACVTAARRASDNNTGWCQPDSTSLASPPARTARCAWRDHVLDRPRS
jgi:hypothetical protein